MGFFNFGKKENSRSEESEVLNGVIDGFKFLPVPQYAWPQISDYHQLRELYPKGEFIRMPEEIPQSDLKKFEAEAEDTPKFAPQDILVFCERVWGCIRRNAATGYKFEVDVTDYSLQRCCQRAKGNIEIEAVYSETAIFYYLSGRRIVRKVMPTGVYDVSVRYPKWTVETIWFMRNTFPKEVEYCTKLQRCINGFMTRFLVSPDKKKFICAVDMHNVSPGDFGDVRSLTFRTGLSESEKMIPYNVCLRPSFYWFSVMVKNGYYEQMVKTPQNHCFEYHVGFTTKRISLNIGLCTQAEMEQKRIKDLSLPCGIAQLDYKQKYLVNNLGENWKNDNVEIIAPFSVYQNWGLPFDDDELSEINSCIFFKYTENRSDNVYPRFELLRFTKEEIIALTEKAVHPGTQEILNQLKNGGEKPEKAPEQKTSFERIGSKPQTPTQPKPKAETITWNKISDLPEVKLLQRRLPFIVDEPDLLDLYRR